VKNRVRGLALVLALMTASAAAADTPQPLRVIAFAGGSNWPIWVGQERGFFQHHGVAVELSFTRGSVQLAQDLAAGRVDFAMVAIDNVVAYDEGQGEADLAEKPDFVAVMGCDDGMLNVMAASDIPSMEALKGRTISVDAMTTGFAFVLRELLARAGVPDADVHFVQVGGGAQRLEALKNHEQDATLLNTPLDLLAEAAGFRRLIVAREAIGSYQGIVGAVRRSWAKDHAAAIIAYMRGYRDAIQWLYAPANRDAALAILEAHLKGTSPALAARIAEALLAPKGGLFKNLAIDSEGMATVLRLRTKYRSPDRPLTEAGKYLDLSFRADALGGQ
jgi:ABC-type nitrate/sulfonate/bicarbonate transport system substrate-binding protein